jgi:hypothetical protein
VSLLAKTKSLLGKRKPAEPTPFSVRCLCGVSVKGERTSSAQILACPECGGSVFVFPESAFPIPETKEDPAKETGKSTGKRPRAVDRRPRQPSLTKRASNVAGAAAASLKALIPPRSWFSTPKLVAFAVVAFVLLTVGWQMRQRTLSKLRELAVPEGRRGMTALGAGELEDARARLEVAIDALDRLGEPSTEEPRFRQAYRELSIYADLISGPLESELKGLSTTQLSAPELHGRAIMLDTEVQPRAGGGWDVGYATILGDGSVAPVHPDGLKLFEDLGISEKKRVIFGARIDDVVADIDGSPTLRLLPDSGVLMTESTIYSRLDLNVDRDVNALRQSQKELMRQKLGLADEGGQP